MTRAGSKDDEISRDLLRNPHLSNREVARGVGCDPKTVGRVRLQMAAGEIPLYHARGGRARVTGALNAGWAQRLADPSYGMDDAISFALATVIIRELKRQLPLYGWGQRWAGKAWLAGLLADALVYVENWQGIDVWGYVVQQESEESPERER